MKNIHKDRIHLIHDKEVSEGRYILYFMATAFREHWNHALEYAVGLAEKHDCSVVTCTLLDKTQKNLTERHIKFHVEGLQDVKAALSERRMKFVFRVDSLKSGLKDLLSDAMAVVTDFVYLKEDVERLNQLKDEYLGKLIAVESNVVVPVKAASDKQEYAARTIRGDLMEMYEAYLDKPTSSSVPKSSLNYSIQSDEFSSYQEVIDKLRFSEHTDTVEDFIGGTEEARKKLDHFLENKLEAYDDSRQSPTDRAVSHMSLYLRNGHIAPTYILSRLKKKRSTENAKSFIEELLVRRELAHNFVFFADLEYDTMKPLPDWAKETLEKHKNDEREFSYTRSAFENGETHDEAWNECMSRMRETGYLHNHMRMFWGKQILAWSNTPSYAHKTILYLNNKYFLDGNDPNSYANALWILGLHDRAWGENEVFGKVRKMNRSGLNSKIDVDKFVDR